MDTVLLIDVFRGTPDSILQAINVDLTYKVLYYALLLYRKKGDNDMIKYIINGITLNIKSSTECDCSDEALMNILYGYEREDYGSYIKNMLSDHDIGTDIMLAASDKGLCDLCQCVNCFNYLLDNRLDDKVIEQLDTKYELLRRHDHTRRYISHGFYMFDMGHSDAPDNRPYYYDKLVRSGLIDRFMTTTAKNNTTVIQFLLNNVYATDKVLLVIVANAMEVSKYFPFTDSNEIYWLPIQRANYAKLALSLDNAWTDVTRLRNICTVRLWGKMYGRQLYGNVSIIMRR